MKRTYVMRDGKLVERVRDVTEVFIAPLAEPVFTWLGQRYFYGHGETLLMGRPYYATIHGPAPQPLTDWAPIGSVLKPVIDRLEAKMRERGLLPEEAPEPEVPE